MQLDPLDKVIVSRVPGKEAYHTSSCRIVETKGGRGRKSGNPKKLTFLKDAEGYYGLQECSFCQEIPTLSQKEMEEVVKQQKVEEKQSL